MLETVHEGWKSLFDAQREQISAIQEALSGRDYIPEASKIFRAFEFPPEHYRVLILGQDPYPNPEHAVGLAFAVPAGTKPLPASLRNMMSELSADLGAELSNGGDLLRWRQQGVMLLNRHLTTGRNETGAHFEIGWDGFTSAAVAFLQQIQQEKLVAILWGNKAQQLRTELPLAHLIESPHPSPLSAHRGFFGSRPFSGCNKALLELGLEPIDWSC